MLYVYCGYWIGYGLFGGLNCVIAGVWFVCCLAILFGLLVVVFRYVD